MRNLLIATILAILSSSYWVMGTERDNQQYQSIQPIQAELDKK